MCLQEHAFVYIETKKIFSLGEVADAQTPFGIEVYYSGNLHIRNLS